jgi:hypothetical protein
MSDEKPDANCVSLDDGSCVGENCMHDPLPPMHLQDPKHLRGTWCRIEIFMRDTSDVEKVDCVECLRAALLGSVQNCIKVVSRHTYTAAALVALREHYGLEAE